MRLEATDGPVLPICTLLRHCDMPMGLQCLATLHQHIRDDFRHIILDDGTLEPPDCDALRDLVPLEIISRGEADDLVVPHLRSKPNCRRFRTEHPFALKLIDPPLITGGTFGLCDCDILFLRPFFGFDRRTVGASHEDIVFMRDRKTAYSVSFAKRHWGERRVRMPEFFNAGMLYVGPRTFDLDFVEWFLGRPEYRRSIWVLEQTVWAALGGRVHPCVFEPSQVAFPAGDVRIDRNRVALHFISPTRHRLEETRYVQELQEQAAPGLDAAVVLRTRPALFFGAMRDAAVRVARRLRPPR